MSGLLEVKKYQLVIEFRGDGPENLQRITDFELSFENKLKNGEIDGNDVGQGIINLFIITKNPAKCFEEIIGYLKLRQLQPSAAGYRLLDEDDYVRLWPDNDKTPFELK